MRTSRRLFLPVLVLLAAGLVLLAWWRGTRATPEAPTPPVAPLVAALRSEPRGFNRLVTNDRASLLVSQLLHARLVQLDHQTQEIEPALAERWTLASDERTYTLTLRTGVTFSDGAPFTADDVVFTFRALYDPRVASPLAGTFLVGGQPIAVRKVDPGTVVLTFPRPYGPGLRLLNSLPILPAHKLQAALDAGTFREAWTVTTPPGELAGLGPFVLRTYARGDRLEFARNPHYAARGVANLPRLDRLILRIVPTQNAEILALEAGEIDVLNAELRADDLAATRKLATAGRAQLFELGTAIDADSLWFNLGPGPAAGRPWLDAGFRRAVAHAIDRQAFINTVYLGAGRAIHGPVTPGNKTWHHAGVKQYAFDPPRAAALLRELGLMDRNGDGRLETAVGSPLRLEILTQKGHAVRERAAAFLEADLEKAGLTVDVVALDLPALVERLTAGRYDAAYFGVTASDTDPSANLDYWLSSGGFHVWHPNQARPATPWEAEMDALMQELTALTDQAARRQRFARVQEIFANELPAIFIAAPALATATSARVTGPSPAVIYPFLLWRADTMAVR